MCPKACLCSFLPQVDAGVVGLVASVLMKRLQSGGCVAAGGLCDVVRGSHGNYLPAAVAGFGADVDDPVCGGNKIDIVFDHDDGVAGFDQPLKDSD